MRQNRMALISLWLILLGSFIHMGLTVMPVIAYNHPKTVWLAISDIAIIIN